MSIQSQCHFLNMKIKSCFPPKQLGHLKPNFVCKHLGTLSDNKVLFYRGGLNVG